MRRATAVLTACLCAISGCGGGAAQQPYEGVVVSSRTTPSVPLPAVPAPEPEPIASEVDIPWTIALLSEGVTHPAGPARHVTNAALAEADALDDAPEVEPGVEGVSLDLQLAIDNGAHEKPAPAPKVCPGVVKRRT